MDKYISKAYLEQLLNDHLSESNGAEHYAYNIIKQDLSRIPTVETLEQHPTEAIVLRFKFDDMPLDELECFFEVVQNRFPDNVIIAIPDNISLESCSKDVLENYISMIATMAEEL
jgi:hypothetical protein